MIKLCAHKEYLTHLRTFLSDHPLLVLEIGFRPVCDARQPYGFAVERTVPGARRLRHWQQHLDNALLQALLRGTVQALLRGTVQALLRGTVQALQDEIPGLGETVAVAVKHIYAWVAQNNRKAYVPDRYDPARQPAGDPDCRLGVKTSSNQERAAGPLKPTPLKPTPLKPTPLKPTPLKPTPLKPTQEYVWGYGSGVVAATDPAHGDVVLAEYTQHPALQRGR